MEKNFNVIIIVCISLIAVILTIGGFVLGKHRGYVNGTRDAGSRTAELITELNGYKQREAERIERARERDTSTASQLERLGGIGTTTTTIITRLRAEISILQDYYNSSRNDHFSGDNSDSGNGEP